MIYFLQTFILMLFVSCAFNSKKSEIRKLRSGKVINTKQQVKIKKEALDNSEAPVAKHMRLHSPPNSSDEVEIIMVEKSTQEYIDVTSNIG